MPHTFKERQSTTKANQNSITDGQPVPRQGGSYNRLHAQAARAYFASPPLIQMKPDSASHPNAVQLKPSFIVDSIPLARNWYVEAHTQTPSSIPRALPSNSLETLVDTTYFPNASCDTSKPSAETFPIGGASKKKSKKVLQDSTTTFMGDVAHAQNSTQQFVQLYQTFVEPERDPVLSEVYAMKGGANLEKQVTDDAIVNAALGHDNEPAPLNAQEKALGAAIQSRSDVKDAYSKVKLGDTKVRERKAKLSQEAKGSHAASLTLKQAVLRLNIAQKEDELEEEKADAQAFEQRKQEFLAAVGLATDLALAFVGDKNAWTDKAVGGARRGAIHGVVGASAEAAYPVIEPTNHKRLQEARARIANKLAAIKSMKHEVNTLEVEKALVRLEATWKGLEIAELNLMNAHREHKLAHERLGLLVDDCEQEYSTNDGEDDAENASRMGLMIRAIPKVKLLISVSESMVEKCSNRPQYTNTSGVGYALAHKVGLGQGANAFTQNIATLVYWEKKARAYLSVWKPKLEILQSAVEAVRF